jgi:drug/metabolite transporter (DMT)-like permease
MLDSWIFWSVLAAVMQSVRTAGQKYLAEEVSPLGATLVRYLFAAPFVVLYVIWLLDDREINLPKPDTTFLLAGLIAAMLQIIATVLLVKLFSLRNFAVGSCYIRSEILATAILGLTLFGEAVSGLGFLSMLVCVSGLVAITIAKSGKLEQLWNKSAIYGLTAGVSLSLTSLLIRQASLSFGIDDALLTAALTLAYLVLIQTVICLGLLALKQPQEFTVILVRWRISLFVGLTSLVGSVGWFTAFTLERAAYVKTLGQVEFLFTLAIAVFVFREIPNRLEWLGMGVLLIGVVALLLAS